MKARPVDSEQHHPPAIAALEVETGSYRPPVSNGITDTAEVVLAPDICLQEWNAHITRLKDQPKEVLDSAYAVFQLAFAQQPMSGVKARALILVSLLWSSRRLHGNNQSNEKYLLARLTAPARLMNKAFGTLAAVIKPENTRNCGDCLPI